MKNKILELDGFRAIAVSGVVIYHLNVYTSAIPGFNEVVSTGLWGVYLFFILSGFLLSVPFLKAAKQREAFPNTIDFYKRRMLRIFPLYYLALFAFIPYHNYVNPDKNIDYFNYFLNALFLGDHDVINPVFWTLKVEVRFYLILPLIGYVLYNLIIRKRFLLFYTVIFLGIIISPIYRYFLYPSNLYLHSPLFLANLDAFFYGIACAAIYVFVIQKREEELSFKAKSLLYIILIISFLSYLLLAFLWRKTSYTSYPFFLIILNTILSICITATLYLKSSIWNSFLNSRAMLFISTISYSVYVWHFWLYYAVAKYASNMELNIFDYKVSLVIKAMALVATFAVSTIVYKFFESPFLKKKGLKIAIASN